MFSIREPLPLSAASAAQGVGTHRNPSVPVLGGSEPSPRQFWAIVRLTKEYLLVTWVDGLVLADEAIVRVEADRQANRDWWATHRALLAGHGAHHLALLEVAVVPTTDGPRDARVVLQLERLSGAA